MKKRQIVGQLIVIMIVGVGLIVITPSGVVQAKSVSTIVNTPKVLEKDKIIVTGIVKLVHKNKDQVTILDENGKTYEIFLGPKWFLDTKLKVGDNVKVEGVEFKTGKINAWQITLPDGNVARFRDGNGKPEWAGKKRAHIQPVNTFRSRKGHMNQ